MAREVSLCDWEEPQCCSCQPLRKECMQSGKPAHRTNTAATKEGKLSFYSGVQNELVWCRLDQWKSLHWGCEQEGKYLAKFSAQAPLDSHVRILSPPPPHHRGQSASLQLRDGMYMKVKLKGTPWPEHLNVPYKPQDGFRLEWCAQSQAPGCRGCRSSYRSRSARGSHGRSLCSGALWADWCVSHTQRTSAPVRSFPVPGKVKYAVTMVSTETILPIVHQHSGLV